MNNVLISCIFGYLTDFFGIGIGILCAYLLCIFKKRYFKDSLSSLKKNMVFSFIFEFSSGLMMAVVTFRLIPEALLKCGELLTILGVGCGLFLIFCIEKFMNTKNVYFKTGIFMLINLWLHNIPEGFILGNMINSDMVSAVLFFSAIVIHNIPQGFLIALPTVTSGIKKRALIYLTVISGIPTALGAALGAKSGGINQSLAGFILGLASGAMLYVLVFELSYEARKLYGRKIVEGAYITGLILGIITV